MSKVLVLVLTEPGDEFAQTTRDLDAQQLSYAEFAATFLVGTTDDAELARLARLVERRPNLATLPVTGGNWADAASKAIAGAGATHVLVVRSGTGLFPQALPRLVDVAAAGHDVVVGRQVGRPLWGSANGAGPVAAVLVAADHVPSGVQPRGGQSAEEWLAGWHAAVLAATEKPAALEEYPTLRAVPTATAAPVIDIVSADATWTGRQISVRAGIRSATPELDPVLVLRGPEGIEYRVPTDRQANGSVIELTGQVDVGTAALGAALTNGEWIVAVETTGPGQLFAAALPKVKLPAAIIDGRPVLVTVRAEHFELQVGLVRRGFFRAEPEEAEITESARGTVLSLPLRPLHSADTSSVPGRLLIGKLPVPAELDLSGERPLLKACLSGLSGSYPLSVAFGHLNPVSLKLLLVVDGTGQMELVHRERPGSDDPTDTSTGGVRARVRDALPESVVSGLKKLRR